MPEHPALLALFRWINAKFGPLDQIGDHISGIFTMVFDELSGESFDFRLGDKQRLEPQLILVISACAYKHDYRYCDHWMVGNKLEHRSNPGFLSIGAILFQIGIILKRNYSFTRKLFGPERVTKSLHTDAYQTLTELLREARKRAGLTQQEVADRLNTHQSYVAKVEKGERRIDVVEFVQLAKAIGASSPALIKKIEAAVVEDEA